MTARAFSFGVVVFGVAGLAGAQPVTAAAIRPAAELYATQCASCHGADLSGGGASSLVDGHWEYGVGRSQVVRRIKFGIEEMGMPGYEPAMSDAEIGGLVDFIFAQEKKAGPGNRGRENQLQTRDYTLKVETVVASGTKSPWAIDWLSPSTALVTEKGGRLRVLTGGKLAEEEVAGVPESAEHGQGGLMDVAVDPEYAKNGWIYLSYTASNDRGFMTRVVRGKIKDNRWVDQQVLFEPKPEWYTRAGVHFGSRIVFDGKGRLFFSIGDRGSQGQAQDTTRPNGKVHRINTDGTIPADNPFAGEQNACRSIFSYGNRNVQGLAVHPSTGQLYATEHGPMGGDELNAIRSGKNYGWPVITYGKNYNGTPVSSITEKEGMEQPVTYWTPSIAACGLDFYTGDLMPKWKNNLLVGALAFQEVRRVVLGKDGNVVSQEVLIKNQGRVRDVSTGPDGAIWIVFNGPDRIVRLVPASAD